MKDKRNEALCERAGALKRLGREYYHYALHDDAFLLFLLALLLLFLLHLGVFQQLIPIRTLPLLHVRSLFALETAAPATAFTTVEGPVGLE